MSNAAPGQNTGPSHEGDILTSNNMNSATTLYGPALPGQVRNRGQGVLVAPVLYIANISNDSQERSCRPHSARLNTMISLPMLGSKRR
jgi:hypothetical protein